MSSPTVVFQSNPLSHNDAHISAEPSDPGSQPEGGRMCTNGLVLLSSSLSCPQERTADTIYLGRRF